MFKELIIPFAIVAILGAMLLPVPPMLLDFLLVINLVLALALLISSLYISEPLKLSALPTMLLLATLYRLSLNISTTRLILGSGEGGRIVEAFGSVVINGNLIVGTVIFLVITMIQFIVIAKGSERVAEVSARFTLDALPGKQMSIDADVRAGLIDFENARNKRQELQTESRFYGALDGAMKFIKGDAIAGIVITAINVVGGLIVGVGVEGLEIKVAVAKYTMLTIGDGLVSQIPALLNSLAAGMIVTRVVRGNGDSLASELVSQLGQVRKVKVILGAVSLLLCFIPGMPILPFITVAVLLLLTSTVPAAVAVEKNRAEKSSRFNPKTPAIIQIEVGHKLARLLYDKGQLTKRVDELRDNIYAKLGIILGVPELTINQKLELQFRINSRGVNFVDRLVDPIPENALSEILNEMERLVCSRPAEFIDDILTRRTLDCFEKQSPDAAVVVPGVITITQLTEILKRLAEEGLSIRNFDMILQAIAEAGPKAIGERALYEEVRIALRRIISAKYSNPQGVLLGFTLDPVIDLALVKAEKENHPLDTECFDCIEGFIREIAITEEVLVVSRGARKLLQECLLLRKISIVVLAFEEIVPEIRFERVGHITLEKGKRQEMLTERLESLAA